MPMRVAPFGTREEEAVATEDAPSALSLASAFLPEKEAKQKEQEFELLMRDVAYRCC